MEEDQQFLEVEAHLDLTDQDLVEDTIADLMLVENPALITRSNVTTASDLDLNCVIAITTCRNWGGCSKLQNLRLATKKG